MSDREIYSHSGSLASLVSDLKNGQRGIDSDSGDWVYKDYSGVIHASRSYKSYSGSVWNYNTLPTGLTGSRGLITDASGNLAVSTVTATELSYLSGVSSDIQTQLNGKISASGLTANYLPMYNGSSLVNSVFQQSASMMSGIVGQFKFGNSSLNFVNSGYTNTIAGWCCNAELKEVGGVPMYHSVVGGSVGILRNNGSNFEFCINTATSAGQQLAVDVKMRLSATGLFLSGLTANTVLVANASRYVTSSSVTPTELSYLSGVSSAIQTQLNGKLTGSGATGQVPYFTSSGAVGGSKCIYSPSQEQFMWYTSANSELMRLVNEHLWLNTRLVCNGMSTGDTGYISVSTSTHTIDVSTITQQNIKISSSANTTLYLYKAWVGTLIYLTNIGANQINVSYDNETGGPKHALYPGQTMQLLCVNFYGAGSQSCTWAIWRSDINTSAHLDD